MVSEKYVEFANEFTLFTDRQLKDELAKRGYAVENLWSTDDVPGGEGEVEKLIMELKETIVRKVKKIF